MKVHAPSPQVRGRGACGEAERCGGGGRCGEASAERMIAERDATIAQLLHSLG